MVTASPPGVRPGTPWLDQISLEIFSAVTKLWKSFNENSKVPLLKPGGEAVTKPQESFNENSCAAPHIGRRSRNQAVEVS